jgi:hypothetical protein
MSTRVVSSSECDSSMLVISCSQSQVVHTDNGVMSMHASILVDSVGPPSAEVCRTVESFP